MEITKIKPINSDKYFKTDHLKSNIKKRAVKGAGYTILSQITCNFIQIIGTIILARILIPDDFGIVAMVTSISGFFLMFRRLGLTDATVQRKDITHVQISTLFWINLLFSLGLTLILICLSPLVAKFYHEPKLTLITIVTSLGFVIGGISTQHVALIRRNLQFHLDAFIAIAAVVISTIVSIYMALNGWGYWALVAKPLVSTLSSSMAAWILCSWRPGLPTRGSGVLPMLKFGINVLGNYTVTYFAMNLDKILIGWRYGAESLGFYHKAFHLFLAPAQQTSYPLTSVAVATLSRLVDDPEKYLRYYLKSISMLAFVGFPLSAVLTVMSKDIILLLLGPQWENAAGIFSAFGVGIGIQMIYASNAWLHLSLGNADRWFRWGIIASLAFIISFIIGLSFGAFGVAISYTACIHILIGFSLKYAGKPINLKLLSIVSALWRFYLAAFATGLVCWIIYFKVNLTYNFLKGLDLFSRLLSGTLVCTLIYLLLVILLYKNTEPIREFISVLRDMVPSKLKNGRA